MKLNRLFISVLSIVLMLSSLLLVSCGGDEDPEPAQADNLQSKLINGSPWRTTAYKAGTTDFFTYQNKGNSSCYPAGVYDQDKIKSGIYTFTNGNATHNITLDTRTYNCSTSSYTTGTSTSTQSYQWKIGADGKFIIVANGQEVAWLTATITNNGNKISFDGTAKGVVEGQDTSPFSFVIEK